MKRPEVHFNSSGSTGNIFAILGMVRNELRKQRRISEYNGLRARVQECGSYEKALAVVRETVDLIDDDGRV